MSETAWEVGDEITVADARGIRRVRVVVHAGGKLGVRNVATNRLSYLNPRDVRIQRDTTRASERPAITREAHNALLSADLPPDELRRRYSERL